MFPAERRAKLISLLTASGFLQVGEISQKLDISPITVRRDLQELEKEGICIRKRGGAISRSRSATMELPYAIKQVQNQEVKKRIAETAIQFVESGDSVILDSGSTAFALASRLVTKRHLYVVTNDLYVASKLGTNPEINTICTGGNVRPNVFSLQGSLAESCFSNLKVDTTFLGADAVHDDGCVYNVNFEEVPIKLAMIRSATQVILLADSTKFQIQGFAKVCELSELDYVITDQGITPEQKEMIRSKVRKDLIVV